VQSMQEL